MFSRVNRPSIGYSTDSTIVNTLLVSVLLVQVLHMWYGACTIQYCWAPVVTTACSVCPSIDYKAQAHSNMTGIKPDFVYVLTGKALH